MASFPTGLLFVDTAQTNYRLSESDSHNIGKKFNCPAQTH